MMRMTGFTTALVVLVVIISPCIYGKEFSDDREIKIQRLLKRLNKPALKSIKSEDGDIIDCVPITSQPAFDHPLLKNHTIQMRPTFIPKADSKFIGKEANDIAQVWRKNGHYCPKNTVPIRRIKRGDILRAKSIESFGKKDHQIIPGDRYSDLLKGHEYAVMSANNGQFFGTKFVINVWRPQVEGPGEFSLAQTWLTSGNGSTLNTIEAGWQVCQRVYGDNNTRFFIFWTGDGYQTTGCYNLECPAFVQTSKIFVLGGSLSSVSQYNGIQSELSVLIWKDNENWWLKIGEELVGYWPRKLYHSLRERATRVQWGGEIINSRTDGRHTTTDMGSGHFADEGVKKASYFRNLKMVDSAKTLKEPQGLLPYAVRGQGQRNVNCYNIKAGNGGTPYETHFYYGGPGQNVKCH